jgi:hypothetical protein
MKAIKIFIAVTCIAVVAISASAFINSHHSKANTTSSGKGFAVIELFTSEGCSSCPPADKLIARIEKESGDKPIYVLAYHVDYWNRLGWVDTFSRSEYSDRQKRYAQWLKNPQYYTPQAVINGVTECVGSEETNLRNAIKTGLDGSEKTKITLGSIKVDNNKATVQYHAEGTKRNCDLLMALIQKDATTKVESGENGGHTLSHVQIVNQLKATPLKNGTDGTQNFTLPHGFDPQKWELIGFVQNTSTGEITGASKAAFPSDLSTNK